MKQMMLFRMRVVPCSGKFWISDSKFWILRIILESAEIDFKHFGNLDVMVSVKVRV